ncbi:unnamed protein product [Eruca vesicaria subsp. sativa]|uniref:Uncharacterized protein n=1 Tax=Eruca vesicaria subsp. sativa TaxID=29727 RepID=A0ABC8L3B6_ERUVS|nr:unnamed protein product [Eruca vesicaria subsp. sativa]
MMEVINQKSKYFLVKSSLFISDILVMFFTSVTWSYVVYPEDPSPSPASEELREMALEIAIKKNIPLVDET